MTIRTPADPIAAPTRTAREVRRDALRALSTLARESPTPAQFLTRATASIGEHFGSPYVRVHAMLGTQSVEWDTAKDHIAPLWRTTAHALLLELDVSPRDFARLYPPAEGSPSDAKPVAVLASPILTEHGSHIGGIAVFASCADSHELAAASADLRAACTVIAALLPTVGARQSSMSDSTAPITHAAALGKAGAYGNLTRFAFAATNALRAKFHADQVCFATIRGGHARIESISGLDDVKPRSPGVRAIAHAMEECADMCRPICVQQSDQWSSEECSPPFRLHRTWHEEAGGASVLTVPLEFDQRVVGVMALRRSRSHTFSDDEINAVATAVASFAPAINVVRRAGRSLPSHAIDAAAGATSWCVGRHSPGRKALLALLILAIGWIAFGSAPFIVAAPSTVVSTRVIHVAASLDAPLQAAFTTTGDEVTAGQPMWQVDTRQLELAMSELRAERDVARGDVDRARAAGTPGERAEAMARWNVTDARLRTLERKLAEATVTAPENGIILQGDLRTRIGQVIPRGEPLVELAPHDGWRIEIHVPEARLRHLEPGMHGTFAATARPEEPITFVIERILPAAEVRHGRNGFVVWGRIEERPGWFRVGMEGVARIDAGRRPPWWIVVHPVADAMRLRLWL